MAVAVGAVNRVPVRLKKASTSNNSPKACSSRKLRVVAQEIDEKKQTDGDRWKGLIEDVSDDQQDITRGKGLVDTLFQAPTGMGTHDAVLSSYEYISQGLREYNLDNKLDGFYIAPAFMDKLVVHITKNFMTLPNIKIPLILGIWGGKGQGKSFQCELVFRKMGINPIMMSAGELESGNAGEPTKLIRQRYREAADIIKKGKMCCLFINDLDAGAGRMGGTTQYTVNNQMVNATLMNIVNNPTNVQLPGMYNKQENPRGIFRTDGVPDEAVVKLVDTFPGQSIDFFGALRARVYDDEVRKWVSGVGIENIGIKLEQENVKRVQLAETYLKDAALGEANKDSIDRGIFYGKAAQQVNVPVPEGCTDPSASNYDPTARSDDGSCLYKV
ncbi:hypothetical protein SASPL_120785 [Salvia splendens]|uniref:Ribulose bisphosphate carboxylase/oxygenase activase, chloroplastic n=1 Tax=Salvia splendens TaxID=180675 RepID=A0A8X8XQR0_SALSN|nr:hypothetical protein SASPL_120785 [Salvia splendens]